LTQAFECETNALGSRLLKADPLIDCDSDRYKSMTAAATAWLVVLNVLVPAVLFFLLARLDLDPDRYQLKDKTGVAGTKPPIGFAFNEGCLLILLSFVVSQRAVVPSCTAHWAQCRPSSSPTAAASSSLVCTANCSRP
jgi:hypothetical protein